MALIIPHHLPLSPLSLSSLTSPSASRHVSLTSQPKFRAPLTSIHYCRASSSSSSVTQMESVGGEQPRFKDFPYAASPVRDLMMELISTVESRLDSQLLPCTLPQDVQYYQNPTATAQATLHIRPGAPASPIEMVLGSWMHCKLPTGGALNITSLSSYMNDSSDVPHLVIELIQSSPTCLVLILDLPPRQDLVIHPEYLKTYYEDTNLDKKRQFIHQIPEVQPYFAPSLYIRCVFSPTAAFVCIDTTDSGGETRLEEIVRDNVSMAAKEVLAIWLDLCMSSNRREIGDDDRAYLSKRDHMFKNNSIENDLGSNLPRMFGQETADRVLGVLKTTLLGASSG